MDIQGSAGVSVSHSTSLVELLGQGSPTTPNTAKIASGSSSSQYRKQKYDENRANEFADTNFTLGGLSRLFVTFVGERCCITPTVRHQTIFQVHIFGKPPKDNRIGSKGFRVCMEWTACKNKNLCEFDKDILGTKVTMKLTPSETRLGPKFWWPLDISQVAMSPHPHSRTTNGETCEL